MGDESKSSEHGHEDQTNSDAGSLPSGDGNGNEGGRAIKVPRLPRINYTGTTGLPWSRDEFLIQLRAALNGGPSNGRAWAGGKLPLNFKPYADTVPEIPYSQLTIGVWAWF